MHISLYHDPIDKLHQEALQFLKAQNYRASGTFRHQRAAERQAVAFVRRELQKRGLHVALTVKNAPFDAWVGVEPTGPAFRLEIKGATWTANRYQAAIRNHTADLLIWDCINGSHHPFIIPMAAIRPRRNVAVWSADPAAYGGRWAEFLDAWQYVDRALTEARPHSRQLPLPFVEMGG
jgi:hypothetical protein